MEIKTGKYYQPQINLSGEGGIDTLPVNGADVFCPRIGKVCLSVVFSV